MLYDSLEFEFLYLVFSGYDILLFLVLILLFFQHIILIDDMINIY